MRLLETLDALFEGKEDKLAATFGKKLLTRYEQDRALPQQIRRKVQSDNPQETALNLVKYLAQYDNTTSKKYLQWMITQYVRQELELEDAYKLPELFQSFEKHSQSRALQQRNIEQYKSYRELQKRIGDIEGPGGTAARSTGLQTFLERPDVQEGLKDSTIIYQSPRLLVVAPRSQAASCKLGAGTKWCVAATESANYFDHYMKQGQLYFAYNDKGEKFGIHFETGNFMDIQDHPVYLPQVIKENPEMLAAFDPDQISLAAAKEWREGYQADSKVVSGEETFMTLWREMNFTPTPKGQMKLASMNPVSAKNLEAQGFPVAPEMHAVAIERLPYMTSRSEEKKELLEFYLRKVQGGDMDPGMRLALVGQDQFKAIATPEEKRQVEALTDVDMSDRAEEFGSIADNYAQHGLTPVLLERIQWVVFEQTNGEQPAYSASRKLFGVEYYDNLKDAHEYLQLGDSIEYAIDLYDGSQDMQVDSGYEDVTWEIYEHLSNKQKIGIWEKIVDHGDYVDAILEATQEVYDNNELEFPEGEDGPDYDQALDNLLFPHAEKKGTEIDRGEIDENALWEMMDTVALEKPFDAFRRAANICWIYAKERAEESHIHGSFIQHISGGIEGQLDWDVEYPVELLPRDIREYTHHDEPWILTMTEQDYIDLISFCEKEEEYPDFDSNHITMDKWNYDEWGYGEIDQGSVQEQWNEVDYFMDEDM